MNPTPCDFERIAWEEPKPAARVADWMAAAHRGAWVLDVGCGPGIYVSAMRRVGLNACGVDGDSRLVESDHLARLNFVENWSDYPFGLHPFDVVLSLEVGEHIPEAGALNYLRFINRTGARVVYFSAARPGQGGEGHINCQPKSYWVERFHKMGFWLDLTATEVWLRWLRGGAYMGWLADPELGNGMIFVRA